MYRSFLLREREWSIPGKASGSRAGLSLWVFHGACVVRDQRENVTADHLLVRPPEPWEELRSLLCLRSRWSVGKPVRPLYQTKQEMTEAGI